MDDQFELLFPFKSVDVVGTPGLHVFLMDIHHDTSLRPILEDDSISLTSRTRIRFCSSKWVGLWLIVRPLIHSFHIAHFIFTSTLRFCFNLIELLASNLFTRECGHKLDAFGMHLVCCLFGG